MPHGKSRLEGINYFILIVLVPAYYTKMRMKWFMVEPVKSCKLRNELLIYVYVIYRKTNHNGQEQIFIFIVYPLG